MPVYNILEAIEIILDSKIDLAQGITPRIRYKKPNGTIGYFAATIKEGNKVYYKTSALDIPDINNWEFRASIMIGGTEKLGEPVIIKFVTP